MQQHVVIRQESYVAGTREQSEVGISDQSRSSHDDQAALLVQLARRFPDLLPEDQAVVRHLLGTWVKDD